MTRTESPRTYSPRRLKMDKENVQKASASSSTKKKIISTPSPSKRLSLTRSKTPTSSTLTLASSSPRSAPGTPTQLLTPPGSSKLLRQHFQQLSMSSGRRSSLSSSPYHHQSQQTRMMDTGPVRLLSPRYGGGSSSSSKSPIQVLIPIAVRKSTGGGGASPTTTTEVLAATDCDTSAANSEQSSFLSVDWALPSTTNSSSATHTPPNQRQREMDCMDPVAFTLLRGGEEDLEWLIEHDRSHSPIIPTPPSSFQSQTTTPSCNIMNNIPKVSSSLRDVYGEGYVSREIARPVPVFATRQKM